MLKNPVIYVEVGITGQIDWPFLARNSVLHLIGVFHVAWRGASLEMMGGTKRRSTKGLHLIGLGATGW
jgi:hypothetical protein